MTRTIEIPLRESQDVVEIDVEDLASSFAQILELLAAENSPLSLYLTFALEYEKLGYLENGIILMEEGIKTTGASRKSDLKVLNILAALYIKKASSTSDKREASEILDKAIGIYNQADLIDIHEEKNWLGKGVLLLVRKVYDRALFQFDTLLARRPNFTPAILGKALVLLKQKEYKESLKAFGKALKVDPSYVYSRYGMGLCFFFLGKFSSARKCFERVLTLEKSHSGSIIALGLLDISDANIADGMLKLKGVYQLNKNIPVVLNQLGSHFLYKKDYEKAAALLLRSMNISEDEENKSESLFLLAKISHFQGHYAEAFRYYSQCVKLHPKMGPANLGLAQTLLENENFDAALSALDSLKDSSDSFVKMLFGFLLVRIGSYEQAGKFLSSYVSSESLDRDAAVALASCYELSDRQKALNEYEKLSKGSLDHLGIDHKNNYGVLLYSSNRFKEACDIFESLERDCNDIALKIFFKFNMACSFEEMGEITKSREILKEILKIAPSFTSAHLRLGLSCQRMSKYSEAMDHFNDAIGLPERDELSIQLSWLCLAGLQYKMKNFISCRKSYERVLMRPESRHNQFALVSLGNLHWKLGITCPPGKQRDSNLKRATELYMKALDLNESNLYAANGLGIAFATRKNWKEARDAFLSIKQETFNLDVMINLGLSSMELGQFATSLGCFESVLSKVRKEFAFDISLLICKCLYCQGKSEKNLLLLEDAIARLGKLFKIENADKSLIDYEIALCKQELGAIIMKRNYQIRSSEDLEKSSCLLKESSEMMRNLLHNLQNEKNPPLDLIVLKQRAEYGNQCQEAIKLQWDKQLAQDEKRKIRMEELKKAREYQKEEERQKRAEEERKNEEAEALIESQRKEMEIKTLETIEILKNQKDENSKPPKTPKRKTRDVSPTENNEDSDAEMEIDQSMYRSIDTKLELERLQLEEQEKRTNLISHLRESRAKKGKRSE